MFVVNVDEIKEMKLTETLNVALTPRHPLGMTPTRAGAFSPDQKSFIHGVFRCERGGGGRYFRAAQPAVGIYSHGLVSNRGARFEGRHDSGAERARLAELSRIPKAPGPFGAPAIEGGGDPRREYVGNLQTGTMSVIDPLTDGIAGAIYEIHAGAIAL